MLCYADLLSDKESLSAGQPELEKGTKVTRMSYSGNLRRKNELERWVARQRKV